VAPNRFIGLILLPIVSFSADACIATIYFIRRTLFLAPRPPDELAKGRGIDLSIQFTLFWMPFLVLLGWWTAKPLSLLFGTPVYERLDGVGSVLIEYGLQICSKWLLSLERASS
jgi:Ca2+/H+ antiporter